MSENHETCLGVMLWHVEAVCKNWEDSEQVGTSDAPNLDISTHDITLDHDIMCGDVWVWGIRRPNLHEIFPILAYGVYMS
jgi:hypothetical protein